MKRLYLQIYLGFLAILVAMVVSIAILGSVFREGGPPGVAMAEGFAEILSDDLPADAEDAALQQTLTERGDTMNLDLALWARSGRLVAAVGSDWPDPAPAPERRRRRGRGPELVVALDDGRALGLRVRHERGHGAGFLGALGVLALVVAAGAYPLARRLTRRLESTRRAVEAFGEGDLAARAPVRGRDEVATLSQSFNDAAERIETLVERERRFVAHASHELRSPLTRLRVALHLMAPAVQHERALEEAERDIDELDALVGDLLLGSRLEAQRDTGDDPWVDLGRIVEACAAEAGVPASCDEVSIRGDQPALRRMTANLLDNARLHGAGADAVELRREDPGIVLRVFDRGPGIDEANADRLFEAFQRGAEPASPGSGLGLSLVRQVARYHGGDARLLARPGGGCIAEVRLPPTRDER